MIQKTPVLISINGSPRQPSRTDVLTSALGRAIVEQTGAAWRHIALSESAPHLLSALMRDRLSAQGAAIIEAIEAADILVVGTPVYRASFTGILKHLFDLVHVDALRGRIAVLAATGGSPLHGLVMEHQLRPLMSFFGTHTVPTAVYAEASDFTDYQLTNPAIFQRIDAAARDVSHLLGASSQTLRHNIKTA